MLFRRFAAAAFSIAAMAAAMAAAADAQPLHVLAAGSLREVLGEIGKQYHAAAGTEIVAGFGPSGLLRQRIEKGEHADLLASADMGNPLALLGEGRATRVVMFTRNALCGFATPAVGLTTANFVDRLLDPATKLGTSTPKADPGGDYTWAMFRRIDAEKPGSYAVLDKKAQQIVGGPAGNAPAHTAPTGGKDPVAAGIRRRAYRPLYRLLQRHQAAPVAQMPALQVAAAPPAIAGGPEYGLAVLKGADLHAADLALFMLSPEGQQIFARYGFAPVGLPAPAR